MASSAELAIYILREMESQFNWSPMSVVEQITEEGPVFLKANQRTGDIHIRIEHGLGEGILISCQQDQNSEKALTLGPLPIDFFKVRE